MMVVVHRSPSPHPSPTRGEGAGLGGEEREGLGR